MIKKMMVGLLIAMVGVCFADYKSDFKWNLKDAAKIEKGLAEAKAAKNFRYVRGYETIQLLLNKDATNTSYEELKKIIRNFKFTPDIFNRENEKNHNIAIVILKIDGFKKYILNIINDPEFMGEGTYVTKWYSTNVDVFKVIGFQTWRKRFISLDTLSFINNLRSAISILKLYKKNSISLTAAEIKADCAIFKRAWYSNITKSEEWKKLLVEIELMIKSVE